jgi:hypothetical protein
MQKSLSILRSSNKQLTRQMPPLRATSD